MARKKEKSITGSVAFDVLYEDGSRASNRKVPAADCWRASRATKPRSPSSWTRTARSPSCPASPSARSSSSSAPAASGSRAFWRTPAMRGQHLAGHMRVPHLMLPAGSPRQEPLAMAVRNNLAAHRFELEIDDSVAKAFYREQGNVVTFVHTEVPPALGGQGVGTTLMRGALDAVRPPRRRSRSSVRSSRRSCAVIRTNTPISSPSRCRRRPSTTTASSLPRQSPMKCSTTSRRCGWRRCSNR